MNEQDKLKLKGLGDKLGQYIEKLGQYIEAPDIEVANLAGEMLACEAFVSHPSKFQTLNFMRSGALKSAIVSVSNGAGTNVLKVPLPWDMVPGLALVLKTMNRQFAQDYIITVEAITLAEQMEGVSPTSVVGIERVGDPRVDGVAAALEVKKRIEDLADEIGGIILKPIEDALNELEKTPTVA